MMSESRHTPTREEAVEWLMAYGQWNDTGHASECFCVLNESHADLLEACKEALCCFDSPGEVADMLVEAIDKATGPPQTPPNAGNGA